MEAESRIDCLPSVVLTIRFTSPFFIASTTCGLPSATFLIISTGNPAFSICLAVPCVAIILKPRSINSFAKLAMNGLSESLTLKNTDPDCGIISPAPS